VRFHTSPATCPGRAEAWDLVNQYGSEGIIEFSASYALDQPLNTNSRARAVRAFWGGPAYWGRDMPGIRPTGTEFLPGKYVFASYHDDKRLLDEAIAYIAGFDVKVDVYEPDMVRAMLHDGHAQAIAAREWVDRFPAAGVS
ncbi:MAG TPA: hypothetical protein VE010_22230, partial [Thermoanaerobaculia bacterium]|nr:hypothetical protein [Thermoanaerobaculia bacterium]